MAHVPNTGSLKTCSEPNSRCLLTRHNDPKRKLQYTLEVIYGPTSWVGVNTQTPNRLVAQALRQRFLPHWQPFAQVEAEVRINPETRIDFCLHDGATATTAERRHFIEVKNVSMSVNGTALFPDANTSRGRKHIRELVELINGSPQTSAELLFVVQRSDCEQFATADDIDAEYGLLLREAYQNGLQVTCLTCSLGPDGVTLSDRQLLYHPA